MDPKIQRRIGKTVYKILKKSNLYEMTENKVRQQASEKLGINLDLPDPPYKLVVRRVVESFLEQEKAKADAESKAKARAILVEEEARQSVKQQHEARQARSKEKR